MDSQRTSSSRSPSMPRKPIFENQLTRRNQKTEFEDSQREVLNNEGPCSSLPASSKCSDHDGNLITNICMVSLRLLCPQCVTEYLQSKDNNCQHLHIDTTEKVYSRVVIQMNKLKASFHASAKKLQEIRKDFQFRQNSETTQLQVTRDRVLFLVNKYFDELSEELSNYLKQQLSQAEEELNVHYETLNAACQEITRIVEQQLQGPTTHLKCLVNILGNNYIQQQIKKDKSTSALIKLAASRSYSTNLLVDESQVYSLQKVLVSLVKITKERKEIEATRQIHWKKESDIDPEKLKQQGELRRVKAQPSHDKGGQPPHTARSSIELSRADPLLLPANKQSSDLMNKFSE